MKENFTPELNTEKDKFVWKVAQIVLERKNIMLLRDRYSNNHHQKDRIKEEIAGQKMLLKKSILQAAKKFQVSESEVREVIEKSLRVLTNEDLEWQKRYEKTEEKFLARVEATPKKDRVLNI
jgi:hypothetical protein